MHNIFIAICRSEINEKRIGTDSSWQIESIFISHQLKLFFNQTRGIFSLFQIFFIKYTFIYLFFDEVSEVSEITIINVQWNHAEITGSRRKAKINLFTTKISDQLETTIGI